MTHTADDLAFLAAVCAAPDDDTPRLVYADWLEEHAERVECCRGCRFVALAGQHCVYDQSGDGSWSWNLCVGCRGTGLVSDGRAERAELIRVQCELAAGVECLMPSVGMREAGSGKPLACWQVRQRNKRDCLPWCAACERLADLRARELELFRGMVHAGRASFGLPKSFVTTLDQINPDVPTAITFPVAFVRRGFVDEVRCTMAAWCGGECERCVDQPGWAFVGNRLRRCPTCKGTGRTPSIAGDVVRAAPTVTRVVTDAEPYWNGAGYCWYDASRPPPYNVPVSANLPRPVFDGVKGWVAGRSRWKGFPKRDAALDALSAALVAHGREASGLGWWGGAWPVPPPARVECGSTVEQSGSSPGS